MENPLFHWIWVKQFQQFHNFHGITHAQSCFEGNRNRCLFINLIQKSSQFFFFSQKASAFPFCHHCRRRTAQIQIHFLIAHICQYLCCLQKLCGIVCQDLGNQRDIPIIFRQNIPFFLWAHGTVLVRRYKWCIITIYRRKTGMMCIPKDIARDSFHRREIKFHQIDFSFPFTNCNKDFL